MTHGDIAFVHRTYPNDDAPTASDADLTPGTAAIWAIHSTEPVADQTLHNWPETYDQFVYCRALVREFDPPIDDLQFLRAHDFARFKEAATSLDREYADLFLRNIREMADLPDEVDGQLRQAIDALKRGDRATADIIP